MSFNVVNITDLLSSVGEDEVRIALADFECSKNPEIENFLRYNAIDFAKRKISVFMASVFRRQIKQSIFSC